MGIARTLAPKPTGDVEKRAGKGCDHAKSLSGAKCSRCAGTGLAARSGQDTLGRYSHDFSQLAIHAPAGTGKLRMGSRTGVPATGDELSTPKSSGQDAQTLQQSLPDLPGNPSACVASSLLPAKLDPVKRTSSGSVTQSFEVNVDWKDSPGGDEQSYCAAGCGEYHQFVKGYMKSSSNADGSDLRDVGGKVFDGKPLDPNTFLEDGLDGNKAARYGHRDEKQTMDESYSPTRAHGSKYVGKDSPGVLIGTYADFDLTFVGKLVDRCNGTETTSDPWRVAYRGVIRP